MQVGDLIWFPETSYTALILEREQSNLGDYDHVRLLVTQDVDFKNPTWMSMRDLKRCGEVISESR